MDVIQGLRAVRIVCANHDLYEAAVLFYSRILAREPDDAFGSWKDAQEGVVFRLTDALDVIVTREAEVPPGVYVDAGSAWLCFATDDADAVHAAATERFAGDDRFAEDERLELLNDPVDTAFDTRAFFTNDPGGLPLYIGAPWPRPGNAAQEH